MSDEEKDYADLMEEQRCTRHTFQDFDGEEEEYEPLHD